MLGEDLSALWQRQWPECRPFADELKFFYPDRWVRFHSLPESRRYPDTEAEYNIVLHRYNTVLDELFHGRHVRIITIDSSDTAEPPPPPPEHALWNPGAGLWTSTLTDAGETDPDFVNHTHFYAGCRPWHPGLADDLLRAVADYATAGVMITSMSFDRVHHPYDGGADVLVPTTGERDTLKRRHVDWLPDNPSGF